MGRSTEVCADCEEGCPWRNGCGYWETPEHPASVSAFALDKYEVTVGRFRAFVQSGGATQANPPREGNGTHPLIAGSGWDSAWNPNLPADHDALVASVDCGRFDESPDAATDTQPMGCVNWYEAFAFCAWDGGRLPTEAEWEYTAAGGAQNRVFPWGNDITQPLPANYVDNHSSPQLPVGSEPLGNGRWGHADLAGSIEEWTVDYFSIDYYEQTEAGCTDCANIGRTFVRTMRGGGYRSARNYLRAVARYWANPQSNGGTLGVRCARSIER